MPPARTRWSSAQADEQASQAPRRAQRGGRPRGLGQAGAAGRVPRAGADDVVRELRRGVCGDLRQGRRQGEDPSHRRATDCGHAVNPAQIERQIAGSFVYGLSGLFMEECTVKDGHIEQTNFNTYDSMRIAQMPKVESIIMPSGGFWGGVGEPTICVAARRFSTRSSPRPASASARSR